MAEPWAHTHILALWVDSNLCCPLSKQWPHSALFDGNWACQLFEPYCYLRYLFDLPVAILILLLALQLWKWSLCHCCLYKSTHKTHQTLQFSTFFSFLFEPSTLIFVFECSYVRLHDEVGNPPPPKKKKKKKNLGHKHDKTDCRSLGNNCSPYIAFTINEFYIKLATPCRKYCLTWF